MTAAKCLRCHRFWAFTTRAEHAVITRFCPDCIPQILPRMGVAS